MTLADAIEAVLSEQGPLPGGDVAVAIRKRKADVLAALRSDARFAHTGTTKASRWNVVPMGSFTAADAAERWGCSISLAEKFVVDFEEHGFLERIKGNGRLRVTEYGLELSTVLHEAAGGWGWGWGWEA